MSDADLDVLGPVDYLVVEFPAGKQNFMGEGVDELKSLIERGIVRMLDLLVVTSDADGSVDVIELYDDDRASELGELREFETELGMLLAADDIENIGRALEPGTVAVVLVWENTWAAPLGSAMRRAGGQLVANGRIPTQAILAAIEAEPQPEPAREGV